MKSGNIYSLLNILLSFVLKDLLNQNTSRLVCVRRCKNVQRQHLRTSKVIFKNKYTQKCSQFYKSSELKTHTFKVV